MKGEGKVTNLLLYKYNGVHGYSNPQKPGSHGNISHKLQESRKNTIIYRLLD